MFYKESNKERYRYGTGYLAPVLWIQMQSDPAIYGQVASGNNFTGSGTDFLTRKCLFFFANLSLKWRNSCKITYIFPKKVLKQSLWTLKI
jgi:hypothetical protein